MRADFKKRKTEVEKVFVGIKLPLYLLLKMGPYTGKRGRSKFIELAVVERMATIDAIKQAKKLGE